ncbi:MAG TPA: alpha/beta hydrolase [Streptosporangiaceae bacterium]|nr:alpha/beta hydrolase [Streptosporangiaceae bacterium]
METRTIPAGDGRELCVEIAGEPQGTPVLVHYGTPNSRHLYGEWIADAEKKGIRLICYDRPGYGGSTAFPGHNVASGARDVRAIAEALGHDQLGIWGISGGGPYALACAALLPDLAVAVAVVASPAPYGAEGLDYFAGMGELNVNDMKLFLADPETARSRHRQDWEEALAATPEQLFEGMQSVLSPVDAETLTGDLAHWLYSSAQDGLAAGDQGWWDDGASHLNNWGFDLSDIRVPVKIWHGRQDRMVAVQHGEWLAANVPGAEAEISDRDGHLTMIGRIGEVHDWLLQHV